MLHNSLLKGHEEDPINVQTYKIGLLIMATGKYIQFVPPLIKSAKQYFCTNHHVTFFVFTDGDMQEMDNVIKIYQERLGWPHDTMMRFSVYDKHRELLSSMDYLFACDADMLFVDTVGDEILGAIVATLHPGFFGKESICFDSGGGYETNPISTACVAAHEGQCYFAGGFYGGSVQEFLPMARINTHNIEIDLRKEYIAKWHDESHLNRYFIDNKPTKILSSSYCYPECGEKIGYPIYPKKLIALDKNHSEIRVEE